MALTSVLADRFVLFPLPGKLSVTTLPQLSPQLTRAVQENPTQHLAFDMSRVDIMDSSFLRLCVNLQKRKKEQGKQLYIVNPSSVVSQILDDTNLNQVFPVVVSKDALDDLLAESFYQTYRPYSSEIEPGILVPALKCPVCGSRYVSAYLTDSGTLVWKWPGTDPFPVGVNPETGNELDTFSLQPIVCLECYFTTLDITAFTVLDGEKEVLRSTLKQEDLIPVSKTVKNRRKIMDIGTIVGDTFFDYPRSELAAYCAYQLGAECARAKAGSTVLQGDAMFLIGYLNYAAIRYSPSQDRDVLIGNCRSWLTRAVSTAPPLLPLHQAQSYFILIVSALNLGKHTEAQELWGKFTRMMPPTPPVAASERIDDLWFWHAQCGTILAQEQAPSSR